VSQADLTFEDAPSGMMTEPPRCHSHKKLADVATIHSADQRLTPRLSRC